MWLVGVCVVGWFCLFLFVLMGVLVSIVLGLLFAVSVCFGFGLCWVDLL